MRTTNHLNARFVQPAAIAAAVCVATILGLAPVYAQAVTSAGVDAVIRNCKDFSANRKFSVRAQDKQVFVSTYANFKTAAEQRDCKIDALLLSRAIMKSYPSILSVRVDFYPVPATQRYFRAVVSKAEIVAFGSGQLSQEDLLSSLKVSEEYDERVLDKLLDTAERFTSQVQRMESQTKSNRKPYSVGGVNFTFPDPWFVGRTAERDVLVALTGGFATKFESTIELKVLPARSSQSVATAAQVRMNSHKGSDGYHELKPMGTMSIGGLNALTESFAKMQSGHLIYEEDVYFGWPGRVYKFSAYSRAEDFNYVDGVFQNILRTVTVTRPH